VPTGSALCTEAKAELNAGLIIVTEHTPTDKVDVNMDQATQEAPMPLSAAQDSAPSDVPAPKARRIAHSANRRSADDWVTPYPSTRI